MINDQELQRTLQELSETINGLSNSDGPLTTEEQKYRTRLLRRKDILSLIQESKEKDRKDAELYHTTVYNLLVPWGEKHPVLMFLMLHMMRVKWGSGSFQRF